MSLQGQRFRELKEDQDDQLEEIGIVAQNLKYHGQDI